MHHQLPNGEENHSPHSTTLQKEAARTVFHRSPDRLGVVTNKKEDATPVFVLAPTIYDKRRLFLWVGWEPNRISDKEIIFAR